MRKSYNRKLYKKNIDYDPPDAREPIKDAMNDFEEATTEAFEKWHRGPPIFNLEKSRIDLLRKIKKERKLVITATDKKQGPAIMEIEQYTARVLTDHLNNTDMYRRNNGTSG